ncbi:MAG: arylsulfatase [Candidatus Aminicenantes bacterium]|nr:MAG: arylsulfatase [Candidatus Aminicenantes bacterium]
MFRRQFLKMLGWGAATLAGSDCKVFDQRKKKPNIVFIMADDMGYGDVKCYHPASKIPTPNMDQLANQGIRFTDAHSPSAVCSPTRYGVLTGRYCWRTWLERGVVGGYTPPLIEPDRLTIASLLKQHGYRTGCFGKWHIGLGWTRQNGFTPTWKDAKKMWRGSWQDGDPGKGMNVDFSKPVQGGPEDLGFDEAYYTAACSTIDGPFAYIQNRYTVGIPDEPIFVDGRKHPDFRPRPGWMARGFDLEDVDLTFTEKAIAFMENTQKEMPNRPFFVYLPLSSPHAPWLPPDFVKGKSQDGPRGDLVYLVDWCVGEVCKALDRLKIADQTLIIVTSDNGPRHGTEGHRSSGSLRGYKSHIWEGGHRVPFIARWPGRIHPGSTCDEIVCLTDLMATCAAILTTDLPAEAGPDSYNILPAMLGEKGEYPVRDSLVSHSENGTFAIRRGNWKLICDNKTSGGWVEPVGGPPEPNTPGQLYDLGSDPNEKNDLWEKHPDIVEQLTLLLEKYKSEGRSAPIHSR